MSTKLDWVMVLNEQTNWHSRADVRAWFSHWVGRPTSLLDEPIEAFEEALGFMRRQVAYLHFQEPVDLLWLDTQLKTVTLGLLHHQGAQVGNDSELPRFRTRVKGLMDSDLLRAMKDTLLVQFAQFVGDTLDGTTDEIISRCQGVHKNVNGRVIPVLACYSADLEKRWYDEIAMITVGNDETHSFPTDVERCVNLVAGSPETKFCSDTCRFATFQITKQSPEPSYIADKQRSYRRRQKQAEST